MANDARIRAEIKVTHLVVFLVSLESVAPGRYTLTELRLIEKRWPHERAGKVLPVIVSPTPSTLYPPYLAPLNVLSPAGNVPAEIAAAVSEIAAKRWRRAMAAVATAVLFLVAGAAIHVSSRETGVTRPEVNTGAPSQVHTAMRDSPEGGRLHPQPHLNVLGVNSPSLRALLMKRFSSSPLLEDCYVEARSESADGLFLLQVRCRCGSGDLKPWSTPPVAGALDGSADADLTDRSAFLSDVERVLKRCVQGP